MILTGRGLTGLAAPTDALDAGNSGTTTRLLAGILAAHPFRSVIIGDESLSRRPMTRVIEPLSRMGARFDAAGGCLPMAISGGRLSPLDFTPAVPSAQVKSAVLLAGLQTEGFWEEGLNAWDIAAGVLLVEEAGGRITDLDGGPFGLRSGRILASNGHVHDEMRQVIADHVRDFPDS